MPSCPIQKSREFGKAVDQGLEQPRNLDIRKFPVIAEMPLQRPGTDILRREPYHLPALELLHPGPDIFREKRRMQAGSHGRFPYETAISRLQTVWSHIIVIDRKCMIDLIIYIFGLIHIPVFTAPVTEP